MGLGEDQRVKCRFHQIISSAHSINSDSLLLRLTWITWLECFSTLRLPFCPTFHIKKDLTVCSTHLGSYAHLLKGREATPVTYNRMLLHCSLLIFSYLFVYLIIHLQYDSILYPHFSMDTWILLYALGYDSTVFILLLTTFHWEFLLGH